MGSSSSKPTSTLKRSSSMAYGRIRIDSPRISHTNSPASSSLPRHQQRRALRAEHAAGAASAPSGGASTMSDGEGDDYRIVPSTSWNVFPTSSSSPHQSPIINSSKGGTAALMATRRRLQQGVSTAETSPLLLPPTAAAAATIATATTTTTTTTTAATATTSSTVSAAAAAATATAATAAAVGTTLPGSPPLSVWIVPALCCALAYALYNIFIKKGSAHINPVLGGVILQFVAAMLGICLLLFVMFISKSSDDDFDGSAREDGNIDVIVMDTGEKLNDGSYQNGDSTTYPHHSTGTNTKSSVISYDTEGIYWAILAGIAVGLAEMISFFVSSLGVQAMQSIPIIIGGSVMFGTVLGYVALHEELSYRGWLGVILISVGISLVGMDDTGEGI